MSIEIAIFPGSRKLSVTWPSGAVHIFGLGADQTEHWIVNSLANFLQGTYKSLDVRPALDMQIGRRHTTLVALAEHLWGTDLFSQTNIRETLLSTNSQFSKPLEDIVVIGIIKGACK